MKCQSCGKKEATVKYYEDINGKKQELHFCMDCAKKLGVTDFANLLSPMFVTIPDYKYEDELYCKNCGYRLEDYARTGMFGCPECYNTFEDSLDELFYKLHGKNRHVKISFHLHNSMYFLDAFSWRRKAISVKKFFLFS